MRLFSLCFFLLAAALASAKADQSTRAKFPTLQELEVVIDRYEKQRENRDCQALIKTIPELEAKQEAVVSAILAIMRPYQNAHSEKRRKYPPPKSVDDNMQIFQRLYRGRLEARVTQASCKAALGDTIQAANEYIDVIPLIPIDNERLMESATVGLSKIVGLPFD